MVRHACIATLIAALIAIPAAGRDNAMRGHLAALSADRAVTWAQYQVTTTGADQTHTIQSLGVSAETTVEWGDGSSDEYTGTALRSHVYADADTYTVRILQPLNVTTLNIQDTKVTLNSADIRLMNPTTLFRATAVKGRFDSADVKHWTDLSDFRLFAWAAGSTGTFDSVDVSDWRPATFLLYSMPTDYAGTFDSADVADWRPSDFRLFSMPADYAGTFDSVDVSDWRPTTFRLYSMPSGYAGTFDSVDVSDWRPTTFLLLSMPANYAGTFDSVDVSDWRPSDFWLYSMPTATFAITITANSFKLWTTGLNNFRMQDNALLTAQVDLILWELYQAAQTRTATGGTILLDGTNEDATGVFQAASACPVSASTDGAEVAHELREDGCGEEFNTWDTVTINWSEPE